MNSLRRLVIPGFFLAISALPFQSLNAQVFSSADLTSPEEEAGVSARALALGSAYVAVPGDISSMTFNPAALATVHSFQLGLHQQSWLDGFNQETLTTSFPMRELGTFGLVLNYLDYGTFSGHDANGDPTGTYQSTRMSATVGWGLTLLKDIYIGLSGRGLQQTIAGTSFEAAALDLGGLWRVSPGFFCGASYINWGTYVDDFLLAARFQAGASYAFKPFSGHQTLACLSYSWEPYNDVQLHLGLEDSLDQFLSLRAGYQWNFYNNEVSGFQGFSAGIGFRWEQLDLDYAFLPNGDLGNTQRISLQYDFGGEGRTTAIDKPVPSTAPAAPVSATTTPMTTPSPSSTPNPETPALENEKLKLYFMVPENSAAAVSLTPETAAEIKSQIAQIQQTPTDVQSWMNLGRLYFHTGQKELAIQCFEQVLRLNPDAQALREWLQKYEQSGK